MTALHHPSAAAAVRRPGVRWLWRLRPHQMRPAVGYASEGEPGNGAHRWAWAVSAAPRLPAAATMPCSSILLARVRPRGAAADAKMHRYADPLRSVVKHDLEGWLIGHSELTALRTTTL